MLIGLVVTIQRNDPLRLALVNLLSPGAVPEEVEQVIGPRPQTTPQTPSTRAVPEPTPPPEPTPSTVEVQPRQLPIPDIGPQPDPSPQPVSLDEKHPIRLDLSDPTWSAVLEGARRDDQFFVEGVEKVSARLHMEPLSGELSFDRPTLVTFTSLSGPNGLGMELTLIESKDDLAEISVKGRVVSDGQEFREINLRKRRKDLNESLANTNAVVNRYTLRRAEALAIVNGSGEIRLDVLNQAKNDLVQINLNLPNLIKQRDLLQVQWNELQSIIDRIEELNKKGELVIVVRRFVEESEPSASTESSLTR